MRCLQQVLWRGAVALALVVSGGTGAVVLAPPPATRACDTVLRSVDWNNATALATPPRVRAIAPHAIALSANTYEATSHATC